MSRKNIIIIFILAAVAGLLISALFVGGRVYFFNGKLGISQDLAVLVLGRVAPGEGGQWHNAPELADSIVLVYYNADSKTVNLISLPRDLYGTFGGENFKLNEVVKRNKIDALLAEMKEITGVETEKYVIVDLGIIEKVVDELGGVDVTLEASVTDPVSGFTLNKGLNHLNGKEAAFLVRNRFAPEGDFFREKHQHLLVQAVFDKLSEESVAERTKFFFRILPEVAKSQSNFSIGELIPQLSNVEVRKFNSITLDFSTGVLVSSQDPIGAYILIPKEGMNNYKEVRTLIERKIE
ncbi:MAG: LCP family protein [Candidatus Colwellbacteria bacterium]|nr:LCP family protein [Candidatus Colwellbacteria bacterium]